LTLNVKFEQTQKKADMEKVLVVMESR